eukprot:364132-Chlamydomonas_euryale.AAC.3
MPIASAPNDGSSDSSMRQAAPLPANARVCPISHQPRKHKPAALTDEWPLGKLCSDSRGPQQGSELRVTYDMCVKSGWKGPEHLLVSRLLRLHPTSSFCTHTPLPSGIPELRRTPATLTMTLSRLPLPSRPPLAAPSMSCPGLSLATAGARRPRRRTLMCSLYSLEGTSQSGLTLCPLGQHAATKLGRGRDTATLMASVTSAVSRHVMARPRISRASSPQVRRYRNL